MALLFFNATIGIANSPADYNVITDITPTATSSSTTYTYNLVGSPVDGQIYRYTPPPACSGAVVAGTAMGDAGIACSSDNISLDLSGASVAAGIGYQWQSSPDSMSWTDISGATTVPYTLTESAATYYRAIVTCLSTGDNDSTNGVLVQFTGTCYCQASYNNYPATDYGLDVVSLTGYGSTTINDAGPAIPPASGYQNRTSISIDLQQGNSYSGILTYIPAYSNYQNQIWIDFNDDNNFDASEVVTPVFGTGMGSIDVASDAFTLTVPMAAALGSHRMRVRNITTYSSLLGYIDPCEYHDPSYSDYYDYGTTRDYTVNIIALPPCTGTPVGGDATTSAELGCPATPFTLGATGESLATDYTYQWQSSSTIGGTYTDIPGATTLTYSYTESAPTYYQLVITCPTSVASATSTPVFVDYVGYCYCVPVYNNTPASPFDEGIDYFNLTGYLGSSISDGGPLPQPTNGYEDQTSIPVDVQQGGTYTGDISYHDTWHNYESQIWIDFNDDGAFDISEEVTPVIFSAIYDAYSPYTMTIPITAPVGTHRMRVRYVTNNYGDPISIHMDPCASSDAENSYNYGMARDYTVNIIAAPPCTGMPTAGTAIASTTMGCPSTAFTLNTTGTTLASGLNYQWQSSATGAAGSFSDIAGATTVTYSYTESSPTYFQLVVTCPTTPASETSSPVFVNYVGYCYCTPSYTDASPATFDAMANFTMNGYLSSTINDDGPTPTPPSGYQDRTFLTIDLQQGGTYPGTLTYTTDYYSYDMQIWIDYNDDGVFDVSEEITPVSGRTGCSVSGTTGSYTANIPISAPAGLHRMRVRQAETYSCTPETHMDPCLAHTADGYTYEYGVTRDYMANIIALLPCTGTPVAGTASASPNAGSMVSTFTVSLPGLVAAAGLGFQWQSGTSATGPWTDIAGATNPTYTFTGVSATTYYHAIVTCIATADAVTSAPATITYVPVPLCTPTAASWYPSPGTPSPAYGIDEFSVTGEAGSTIADVGIETAAAPGSGYLNRASLVVDMMLGGTYAASGVWAPSAGYQELQVWVDFNDDLVFDPSEEVTPVTPFSTSSSSSTTFNITIPTSATLGIHNMRVRAIWEETSTSLYATPAHLDPCLRSYPGISLMYFTGDVIDYRVNILSPCPFTATATTGGAICPLSPVSLTATTTAPTYSWTGPDGFISGSLATTAPGIAVAGVYTFTATDGTCTLTQTAMQALLPAAPAPVVTPATASICSGSSQTITATVPGIPGAVILSENFNSGLGSFTVDSTGTVLDTDPTVTTAPWQWSTVPDGFTYSSPFGGGSPTLHSPDNSGFAFTTADYGGAGSVEVSQLISPTFSLAGMATATLTFDNYYEYYYDDYNASVDISTDGGVTWNTLEDYVLTGFTIGSPTSFQPMSYDLSAYLGSANCKVRYYFNSPWGIYWMLDNVKITGTPTTGAAPTWSPVTDLYSDPLFTVPYVAGTPAFEVYAHPTGVASTSTTTNYIASVSLGTCNSVDTSAITVIGVPAIVAMGGTTSLCAGSSISLTNPSTGGTWTSSNTTVATVDAGGVVHGIASGADTIYYNVSGCSTYIVVNVSTVTTPNTGNTILCSGGLTTTLTNTTTGGVWTSSAPSVATVSAGGVVTTGAVGTAIVTYTFPSGCSDTSVITSVAPPAAITGTATVCYNGGTTTLSETTTGGTWSITAPTVATITGSGATITITGLTSGAADVVYTTLPGCTATRTLTLNANPANITGTMAVCASGGATTLSDATGTGTWTSGTPSRATVSSGGVVTGITSGTTVITFTAANGCYDTALVTVNALPSAITGTTTICNLASTTLADASTPGTWTTSTPSITTVNASGVVTALTTGTGTIIFTETATGCTRSATVTVNALPGAITGTTTLCNTTSTTLSSIPSGGTWTTSAPTIASVNSVSGLVSALSPGSATITLTNAAGCKASTTVTVNPSFVPSVVITPTPGAAVCAGTAVDYVPTVTNGGTAPTYSWTVNSVPVSAASSYNYTPLDGDVVAVTIVSNLGCAIPSSASSSVTMTVNPIVTPSLTLGTAYGDTGCVGLSTTIYTYPVSAGAGATFQWFVNGTPVSGGTNYSYVATDGDVVSVNMTSTAGCLSGSTAVVTSSSLTLEIVPVVTPQVLLTSTAPGSVACAGNIVVYSTSETNGGTSPAYLWTINGVNVATGPSYFYTPADGDVVVVQMTSNYACVSPASDTAMVTMVIGTSVTPVATISAHPGTVVVSGINDTFTVNLVSGGGAAPVYQWFINGVAVSGANSTTFVTNTLNSGDLVSCHVTNTDPCGGTVISNILAITVHGGVGVTQVTQGKATISIVPNPNSGSFVVEGTLAEAYNEDMILEVTDMVGQVVYRGTTQAKNGVFNEQVQLNGILANGSYVLSVRSEHMSKVFHFILDQK